MYTIYTGLEFFLLSCLYVSAKILYSLNYCSFIASFAYSKVSFLPIAKTDFLSQYLLTLLNYFSLQMNFGVNLSNSI